MDRGRALTFKAALVVGVPTLLAVLSTFVRVGSVVPKWVTSVLFVLTFPVFGVAVVREARRSGRRTGRERFSASVDREALGRIRSRVPRTVGLALGALLVALWLSAASSFLGASGDPERHDGRYFLNNHGAETEVSKSEYEQAVNRGTRGFGSVAVVFCCVAAVFSKYGGPESEDEDTRSLPLG